MNTDGTGNGYRTARYGDQELIQAPGGETAHDNFWDFVSLMPESTHVLMWIMPDRAIPHSFRFMDGFGVHTFRFVNEAGRSTYVKFHTQLKRLGLQELPADPAAADAGFINLSDHSAAEFITRCPQPRFWDRELAAVS